MLYTGRVYDNLMDIRFRFMVFNTTFYNISVISWQSVLSEYLEKIPDLLQVTDKLYRLLLNDKEFCFFLFGLNSIFSTLPQSEYTSHAVSIPHVRYIRACVCCLFSVLTLFNQIRDFISSRPIKLQKVNIFKNFKISKFYKI